MSDNSNKAVPDTKPTGNVVPGLGLSRAAAIREVTRDDQVLTNILQGLADDQLVVTDAGQAGAVDLRRIEEGAAVLAAVADGFDALLLGRNLAAAVETAGAPLPSAGATSPRESYGFQRGAAGASATRSSAGA